MKKVILTSLIAAMFGTSAMASDGGMYYDTETVTRNVEYTTDTYVQPRAVHTANVARPCMRCNAQPVRVKTYSEVIDHYQVYQPVTVYKPVGTYAKRRIVANKPCGCGCNH